MKSTPDSRTDRGISVGVTVGDLTVTRLSREGRLGTTYWVCKCACGAPEREFSAYLLASGHAKTCGNHKSSEFESSLANRNATSKRNAVSNNPLYNTWVAMKKRCTNPKHPAFADYGGRGIGVCAEWADFAAFRKWAESNGYTKGLTLDRANNAEGYSPGNCRWVPQEVQNRNKRSNLWIEAFGEKKLLIDWSKDPRCAVGYVTLHRRISKGVPAEIAITRAAVSGKEFEVTPCQH